MGSSLKSKSTRARRGRSARSSPKPRPKPVQKPSADSRLPAAIEIAIEQQRDSLTTEMTILYALHCILRRDQEGDDSEVDEAVRDAVEWTDPTDLTSMLLVRLHTVFNNLGKIARGETDVDPEHVALTEKVRELVRGQGGAS